MSDLRKAAQALIDRWDTPQWKDVPATALYINALRAALSAPSLTTSSTELDNQLDNLAEPDFCDEYCTWRDHAPGCPRHEAAPTVVEPVALPCCGYTDASAIKWNPYNQVVQCHNCGQTYAHPPRTASQRNKND
jgi:hypothetical protein